MKPIPGLSERCNAMVEGILNLYPQAAPVVLFGSRAKGNFREGSDIDIALKGECSRRDLAGIMGAFEDSSLPYFVDVVVYDRISNPDLRDHIDRWGIEL